jgi:hypothetical protein
MLALNEFGSDKMSLRTKTGSSIEYATAPFSLPLIFGFASGLASMPKEWDFMVEYGVDAWAPILGPRPWMGINIKEEGCFCPSPVSTPRLIAGGGGEGQGLLEDDNNASEDDA